VRAGIIVRAQRVAAVGPRPLKRDVSGLQAGVSMATAQLAGPQLTTVRPRDRDGAHWESGHPDVG
jgi:hypothetical protein